MSLFVGKNTVNLGVKIEETDRSVQHSSDYYFSIIFFNVLTKLVLFISSSVQYTSATQT